MSSAFKSRDANLAWELHNQINRLDVTGITENASFPDKVGVYFPFLSFFH